MDVQAPQRVANWLALLAAAALLLPTAPGAARAQDGPPSATALPQWEWRIDATAASASAVHSGVGLNVRNGWYLRSGVAFSVGAVEGADGAWRGSHRLDLTARFLLDPFAERRRGVYAGGGVTVRSDAGRDAAARLLVVFGVEGNPERRRLRSIELGLGGGVRLGVVLRTRRSCSLG
jgi:hypothetical protein